MAKSFRNSIEEKTGVDALIDGGQAAQAKKKGRPANPNRRQVTRSAQDGVQEGFCRATFLVSEDQLEKIKAVAYWEREAIKDVVFRAFENEIKRYEKKEGSSVQPKPKK